MTLDVIQRIPTEGTVEAKSSGVTLKCSVNLSARMTRSAVVRWYFNDVEISGSGDGKTKIQEESQALCESSNAAR